MKGINVVSGFDGISIGQQALKEIGIKINKYFASEIDESAIKITQLRHPNTIQIGDIRKVKGKDYKNITLFIGGSPCQSFSSFGDGSGLEGKSGLVVEFIRLVKEIKPEYFLLENVDMKKEWKDFITKELGVEPILINSSEFSAQSRKRLYWTNLPKYSWEVNDVPLSKVLFDLPFREIPKCFYSNWGDKMRIDKGLNWVKNHKANCLTTKNCHTNQYLLNEDKTKCRLLTIEEYEKLQTLPVGYTEGVSNNKRFELVGNGWTLEVIKHLFKGLVQQSPTFQTSPNGDFSNEKEHNISLKDNSNELSQISSNDETSLNNNIMRNFGRCYK